ncbi:MAG TPA: hypothetical protein DCZ04_03645 [Syntrophorhabdus aromaticivorans]|mgnify:CR=1 FL=1|nr:hypothetical protein [Syntrophorhabdus aromaticivorans]
MIQHDFNIERYDKPLHRKDDYLALAKLVFGANRQIMEHKWEWQYLSDTGFGNASLYLALEDDRVAGIMGCLPVVLNVKNHEVRAVWMVDAMTHPDFRKMGVAMRIHDRVESDYQVVMAKSVSDQILPLDKKRGYRLVGATPHLVKVLSAKAFRQGFSQQDKADEAADRPYSVEERASAMTGIDLATKIDDSFDDLWERVRDKFDVAVMKNSLYLNWRYTKCPMSQYAVLQCRSGGRLEGFMVVKIVEKDGWIVETLVDPYDSPTFERLIRSALRLFRHERVARVYTLATHKSLKLKFYRHLFFPARTSSRIIFKPCDQGIVLDDNGGLWHMNEGDSDSELFRT